MENKKLGAIVVIITLLFAGVFGFFRFALEKSIRSRATFGPGGECIHQAGTVCPFQELSSLALPTYLGISVLVLSFALGLYLIFFDKSQKILQQAQQSIVQGLKEAKSREIKKEKFGILLKGLDEDEKRVLVAVKEQDGITQATLRLRTDFSKAKLSTVLGGLERKGLIKREKKGKTNQVFLKEAL
jgi:uncharacterized membrane protein